jgi:hypothetical protein
MYLPVIPYVNDSLGKKPKEKIVACLNERVFVLEGIRETTNSVVGLVICRE